jgi:hypothetical protein
MSSSLAPPCRGFFGDFRSAFHSLVCPLRVAEVFALMGPRGAGVPKLSPYQWLSGLVYHALAGAGTFATHVLSVTGVKISDAALCLRGASFGWELLATLLPRVLRPMADPGLHPDAFHRGLRLLALDGTRFNLRNTPAINARAKKLKCGRGEALGAFAQMLCSVLIELGTHGPLAVSLGWQAEGELTLARDIFDSITVRSLLLADRLYGSPWLLWELAPRLCTLESHYLVRVKSNLKVRRLRRLADGSWIVALKIHDPQTGRAVGSQMVREIHAQLHVQGEAQPQVIRLWTSLFDPLAHPALELVQLYAERWEQELFFRELKHNIHGANQLLHAQTIESAAHEVMALMLGAALLAGQRTGVAQEAQVPLLRISLAQVLEQTLALFEVLEAGRDVLDAAQSLAITRHILERLAITAVIKPRKPRRCQRAERQPTKAWPKMKVPTSRPLVVKIAVLESNP